MDNGNEIQTLKNNNDPLSDQNTAYTKQGLNEELERVTNEIFDLFVDMKSVIADQVARDKEPCILFYL